MRITKAGIGWTALAAVAIGAVTVLSQTGPLFPTTQTDAPGTSVISEVTPSPTFTPSPTPTVTPTPTPTPEPVVEAPAPPPPTITKCPAGTTPGKYDDAGNESNCQANNPNTGQQCVAYNDANQCTAWAKP